MISLVLGYLSGFKEEESLSNGDAETNSKKEPEFLKEGLVAYYPFNGNTEDESGNGNNGQLEGAILTDDRHGNSNSAYLFGGSGSYVQVPHHALLNLKSEGLTLSAWVFVEDDESTTILVKGDSLSDNEAYHLSNVKGNIKYAFRTVQNGVVPIIITTNTPLLANQWSHIVVTHQAGEQPRIFIGGLQNNSISTIEDQTLPRMNNTEPLRFGAGKRGGLPHGFHKGQLDDIRIYNRALSAEEVKALHEFEKAEQAN